MWSYLPIGSFKNGYYENPLPPHEEISDEALEDALYDWAAEGDFDDGR